MKRHVGIAKTQALLNCWRVHTGIASAYLSVAMVKLHGRLYLVSRRGTVREYRLNFRSTYHSFHATLAEGRKAHHEAETTMALNASQDKATPPLHFQGLLLRFSTTKGNGFTRAECGRGDHTPRCICRSSISMKDVASKIASANGQDLSAFKRWKCMRRTPDD